MGFGRKYKDMPTPESVVFRVKIIAMISGALIVMIQGWDFMPNVWSKIVSGLLGATITISHGVENLYGVNVKGPVQAKDVAAIKDEAIKIVIFIILINSYLFFNT